MKTLRKLSHSLKRFCGFLIFSVLIAGVAFFPGYAQGPTPHSVSLTWTPSVTAGTTTQKVYRATVAGGPYTSLATVGAAAANYVDSTGAGGTKYFYVVTALSGGNESISSNEVSASFLANPAPPTGLQAVSN